jgi:hypothetical protein
LLPFGRNPVEQGPRPGGDHVERRLAAGLVEGATQHLAVYGDDALAGLRKLAHQLLEAGAELFRIKEAEHPRALRQAQEHRGSAIPFRASRIAGETLTDSRANSSISEAYCPPHSTVHSAMTMISTRSCRPALEVRADPPNPRNKPPSLPCAPPTVASSTQRLESIRGKPARPNSNVNPASNASPLAGWGIMPKRRGRELIRGRFVSGSILTAV